MRTLGIEPGDIDAFTALRVVKQDFTVANDRVRRQYAHDCLRGNRLTRPGFTDQGHGFAGFDAKGHIDYRGHGATVQRKIDRKLIYL